MKRADNENRMAIMVAMATLAVVGMSIAQLYVRRNNTAPADHTQHGDHTMTHTTDQAHPAAKTRIECSNWEAPCCPYCAYIYVGWVADWPTAGFGRPVEMTCPHCGRSYTVEMEARACFFSRGGRLLADHPEPVAVDTIPGPEAAR